MNLNLSALFTRLIELSPFVAALFLFLIIIWRYLVKKDEALTTTMKEHTAQMLVMQRENIMAQNNAADANRLLSGSLDDLKEHLKTSQSELLREIRSGKGGKNGTPRPLSTKPITPSAAA